MSSAADLCNRVIESGLLSAEEANSRLAEWQEQTFGQSDIPTDDYVDWLVELDLISEFQGDAILAGHVGPFMLGPYRVFEHIAAGRLGGMYRAVHDEFDQPVCLKIFPGSMSGDEEKIARFGREARIFAELDHPNVLKSFQLGRIGDTHYVALEELKGETLHELLERETRLPYQRACALIRDVAKGLQHLHDNEVVHRDLRPENIWVTKSGTIKLFEFGAARDAFADVDKLDGGPELTTSETVLGEYAYMAPEQANDVREANALSDIYALGCVLFHTLAGHAPFTDKNPVQLVLKHVKSNPPRIHDLLDDVPHQLDETILGMMAKDPAARFQSADQVAFSLSQYIPDSTPGDEVNIVEVSQQYLDWIQSQQQSDSIAISDDNVAMTPELTQFIGFMTNRSRKRPRRKS